MESILQRIGPFGKFQKLCTLVVGLISILTSTTIYSTVFILAEPKIDCIDLISNQTISNSSTKCDLWEMKNKTTIECRFKLNEFGKTLVADWALVCNKSFYASLIQTFYLIGTLLSLTMGYIADKYGRKRSSLIISIIILFIYVLNDIIDLNSLDISNTSRYIIYSITQVINGIMNNSIFNITFILLFEITSVKYHTIVSNINLYSYVIGELVVCLVSYLSQDWQIINWFIGGYSALVVVLIALFLPESPSFYIAKRDYKQAYTIIERIARANRVKDALTYDEFEHSVIQVKRVESINDEKITAFSYTFESKAHVFKAIALILIYFALTVTYFGVSLGII